MNVSKHDRTRSSTMMPPPPPPPPPPPRKAANTAHDPQALRLLVPRHELHRDERDTWDLMTLERGTPDSRYYLRDGKCFYKAARPAKTFLLTDPTKQLGSGPISFHIEKGGRGIQISWPLKTNPESVRQLGRWWADVGAGNECFDALFDGVDVVDFVRRYMAKGRTFTTGFSNRPINSERTGIRVGGQTENSRGLTWQCFEKGAYTITRTDVSMRYTRFSRARVSRGRNR